MTPGKYVYTFENQEIFEHKKKISKNATHFEISEKGVLHLKKIWYWASGPIVKLLCCYTDHPNAGLLVPPKHKKNSTGPSLSAKWRGNTLFSFLCQNYNRFLAGPNTDFTIIIRLVMLQKFSKISIFIIRLHCKGQPMFLLQCMVNSAHKWHCFVWMQ